jgi:uncharacterized protein (TIGR02246 family)
LKRTIRVALLTTALLSGCVRGDATDGGLSAAAEVELMKSALTDAVVRKDPGPLAALFAEDAVVVEPDGRILEGRDAIAARIAELLPRVQAYSISSQRLEESGELAYDQETFGVTLTGVDGSSRNLSGHQLVVLRRPPGGNWTIVRSGSWLVALPTDSASAHIH